MLRHINGFLLGTKKRESGAKLSRCHTKIGPGRMPHNKGNPKKRDKE